MIDRNAQSPLDAAMNHESLDVYRAAIALLALANTIVAELPAGYAAVKDQFRRAALSVVLNIAEGYGKPGKQDQRRYYSIARGSAMECGAVIDVLAVLNLIADENRRGAKALAVRVVQMLTKMMF